MKKLIVILIIALAAGFILYRHLSVPEATRLTMSDAKIASISPMLRLCTVEFYEDIPVKASIGTRHIFARMSVNGSISFNLDSITVHRSSDTLMVVLPPEIVDIYESTAPDAYRVIDTWNDRPLASSYFTTAEENSIKSKAVDILRNSIYSKGMVRRARCEAVTNLTAMLQAATGKTVIVTDPTPNGFINIPSAK